MIEIIPNWHPIFVHFTVALLSTSTILFIVAFLLPNVKYKELLTMVARWNLWIGALITMITVAAGFQAYYTVAHDPASHVAMSNHRNWALSTALAFFISALWQARVRRNKNISLIFLLFIIGSNLLLITTAYKGGELVYRHGLGVMRLSTIESAKEHSGHHRAHE